MQAQAPLGILHFVSHADPLALGLLVVMLVMSVLSWTVIVTRLYRARLAKARNRAFAAQAAGDSYRLLPPQQSGTDHSEAAFARLARTALQVIERATVATSGAGDTGTHLPHVLEHALQRQLDDEAIQLESGQTLLASIASSAPFIGLFGTVWGIYHALINIGVAGQNSLEQVAGPIGEALIMTACGLGVAIPAGLAYNAFQRHMRVEIAELEKFAGDLLLRCLPVPVGHAPC